MTSSVLLPASSLSPADAIAVSQQAPAILKAQAGWALPWPLSLLVDTDTPERWTIYENLYYSCLRTGDIKSAYACLDALKRRFGESNERVMGLAGLYHEALAPDTKSLEKVLAEYESIISETPTNMIIRKRHAALLKTMHRPDGAIAALVDLLQVSPTDAESWAEIGDLYFGQHQYAQAVFSFEEVLLVMPNAWNMHARLAEIYFVYATSSRDDAAKFVSRLTRSLKAYARSVELCDDYLRGFYGLKLVCSPLLVLLPSLSVDVAADKGEKEEEDTPSLQTVEALNELATSKLAEIIRRYSTNDKDWCGYDEAEIIAARELLDRA